jgi:predicted TIM-barrel fold metal-dependent hydrolase
MEDPVAGTESESVVIVSGDSHVGPRGKDLREYIPSKYLEAFDDFIRDQEKETNTYTVFSPTAGRVHRHDLNMKTEGHYDPRARIRDMNRDGIAVQVIFHGSQNNQPFPLGHRGTVDDRLSVRAEDLEPAAAGMHAYNAWLADFCSVEPERHVGLAHLPVWDIDLAVRELEWAAEHGLRGINWPTPRPWIPEFDEPVWRPLYAAAQANKMHLNTHSGGVGAPGIYGIASQMNLPRAGAIMQLEMDGWPYRRGLGRMIFGEAFERFPGLKLVLTEGRGIWWDTATRELDQAWEDAAPELRQLVPLRPSEYLQRNVFIGASFMANFEAKKAVELGGFDRMLIWGSDYPHFEGTWAYPETDDEPNRSLLAIRDAMTGLSEEAVRGYMYKNAVRAYDLDLETLQAVANRIQAPTAAELMTPLSDAEEAWAERSKNPEYDYTQAFRRPGAWVRPKVFG